MSNIWCEINKSSIKNNINIIKKRVNNKKIIAILKGNAYGLGIEGIADAIKNDVDMFAIENIKDADLISDKKDVLILSPLCDISYFTDERKNLIFSIDNETILDKIPKKVTRVHIYVDTLNYRMGINSNNLDNLLTRIKNNYPHIKVEGIYTHLHNCKNINETLNQINHFEKITKNFNNLMIHILASSSILNEKLLNAASFTNAVRVGNLLYGFMGANIGIKSSYKFYSNLISTHSIEKGEYIGFGADYYIAKKPMTIGILETGNCHGVGASRDFNGNIFKGFSKILYNKIKRPIYIKYNNVPVKYIGKINMNTTVIDMTNISKDAKKFELMLSPILADSSIDKKYI